VSQFSFFGLLNRCLTATREPDFKGGSGTGIFGLGFLIFTLMLKVAVPITLGEFLGEPPKVEPA